MLRCEDKCNLSANNFCTKRDNYYAKRITEKSTKYLQVNIMLPIVTNFSASLQTSEKYLKEDLQTIQMQSIS